MAAYPATDFRARLEWWRERWRGELVPDCRIVVAEAEGEMVGFVTVDPVTGYLDQIVVSPRRWRTGVGTALLGAAKAISPRLLELRVNADNDRAIAFYHRHGFAVVGNAVNEFSGAPVLVMRWAASGVPG